MAISSYFLKIVPQLSASDAAKTENQMNTRFKKVAKTYGQDMSKANEKVADDFAIKMKSGFGKLRKGWLALAGVVAGAVSAILNNPFDEADQKLNDILQKFDNISTRAKQWGVDSGRYWLLNQVGLAADVPEGGIDQMLLRIADRLDAARRGEDPTLKNYLDEGDVIDVAYRLFQTWRQMAPVERASSMADILGARAANNYAELVETDWNRVADMLREGRGVGRFTTQIEKLSSLQGQQALNRARQENVELFRAGKEITPQTIQLQNQVELVKQREMLDDIRDYNRLALSEISKINLMAGTVDEIGDTINKIWGAMADRWGVNGKEGEERARQRHNKLLKDMAAGANQASRDLGLNVNLFKYGIGALGGK